MTDDIAALVQLGKPFAEFAIWCNGCATDAYVQQTGSGESVYNQVATAIMLDRGSVYSP